MLAYASAQFRLTRPNPTTGKSRLHELLAIHEQTGVLAPELVDQPALPVQVDYLWAWFCDLGRGRTSGMAINPVSWQDLQAYFGLLGIRPARWELDAIRRLDDAYLASRAGDEADRVVTGAAALGATLRGNGGKDGR